MQPEQSGLGTLAEMVDIYARHALAEVLQQDPNFSQGTPRGLCAAGLMVHAEAQGSPSPIDATLVVDVLSL